MEGKDMNYHIESYMKNQSDHEMNQYSQPMTNLNQLGEESLTDEIVYDQATANIQKKTVSRLKKQPRIPKYYIFPSRK